MAPDPMSTSACPSAGSRFTGNVAGEPPWHAAHGPAGSKGCTERMQVTGTRQREAWLKAEFPPVEQVTGGVWSIPVPIIGNPLRYVLSYLIEHDDGFVMIDPGWSHADSWQALTDG